MSVKTSVRPRGSNTTHTRTRSINSWAAAHGLAKVKPGPWAVEAAFQNPKPEPWAALGPLLGSGSARLLAAGLGRLQAYGPSRENTKPKREDDVSWRQEVTYYKQESNKGNLHIHIQEGKMSIIWAVRRIYTASGDDTGMLLRERSLDRADRFTT